MVFNNIFELLTTAADVSEFISLKKTFDNHEQLQIIQRLDKIDDFVFHSLLNNQKIIINLLLEILNKNRSNDMVNHKNMLDKYIDKTKDIPNGMDYIGDIFVSYLDTIKEKDKIKYKNILYNMQMVTEEGHLTYEQAKCWVDNMENKDGTVGEHWSYEETETLRMQYKPEANPCDWYASMNMIYSDYYSKKFDIEDYITLTIDWLFDKDVHDCKALKYYLFVAN